MNWLEFIGLITLIVGGIFAFTSFTDQVDANTRQNDERQRETDKLVKEHNDREDSAKKWREEHPEECLRIEKEQERVRKQNEEFRKKTRPEGDQNLQEVVDKEAELNYMYRIGKVSQKERILKLKKLYPNKWGKFKDEQLECLQLEGPVIDSTPSPWKGFENKQSFMSSEIVTSSDEIIKTYGISKQNLSILYSSYRLEIIESKDPLISPYKDEINAFFNDLPISNEERLNKTLSILHETIIDKIKAELHILKMVASRNNTVPICLDKI